MTPIIYIDMDGVLADLHAGLKKRFNLGDEVIERTKLFKSYLPDYAADGGFQWQPVMPKAVELVNYLLSLRKQGSVNIAILTSAGQFHGKPDVTFQKAEWLKREFPELDGIPFCVTTSGADKCFLAHPKAFLIDDWHKNVTHFVNAGGHGIVYEPERLHATINAIVDFLHEAR